MTSPTPRRCTNWLVSLLDYVEETESPRTFWMWGGISILASALQRRVWVPFGLDTIYPNLYILIVAPPGKCRKGAPLGFARRILTELQIPVFVDSPTKRALTQEMERLSLVTHFRYKGKAKVQCPLVIISKELSSFLAVDPKSMIEILTDLYDSHEDWTYKTSGQGEDKLLGICINCLMATTPSWMSTNLPPEAIGGGFTSRFVLVSGLDKYKRIPIPPIPDPALYRALSLDLARIAHLVGEFVLEPEALKMYEEWYYGLDAVVKHTRDDRLHGYLERIHVIALKVSMVLSVAETSKLIIRPSDMEQAITLLEEVLRTASRALSAHGRSFLAVDTDRVLSQLRQLKEISFDELFQMNWMHTTPEELKTIIRSCEMLGRAECVSVGDKIIIRHKTNKRRKE